MTSTTRHDDLMSLEQWIALGEDNSKRFELVEGVLIVPDVVVHSRSAGARLSPGDVALVVEVLSPSTRSTDLRTKRSEYAAAGIPNYWIVDLENARIQTLTLVDGSYVGDWTDGDATTTAPLHLTASL